MKWFLTGMLIVAMTFGCSGPAHFQRSRNGMIELGLKAPGARSVQIAASLNQYRLQPTEKGGADVWIARLPANQAFKYFYIVDGKPFTPACAMMEQDDFGQFNCIYAPGPQPL